MTSLEQKLLLILPSYISDFKSKHYISQEDSNGIAAAIKSKDHPCSEKYVALLRRNNVLTIYDKVNDKLVVHGKVNIDTESKNISIIEFKIKMS